MTRLAAISVDLDSLPHYCRIQGLDEALLDEQARGLVASRAIPRFLELFAQVGTPATFFVIGEDLALPGMIDALRAASRAGVELANHSHSHDYALSRRDEASIAADLARADDAVESAVGVRPRGFRAPGYTLSAPMLRAADSRGYAYDSSTYPAVPYWLAKAGVMGVLAALGRPSRAVLDSPRVLLAPTAPYRPSLDAPYSRGDARILELPVTVAPVTRVPFIGTFATVMPWPLVEATFRTLRHAPLFNFELHAIDVLDATDGIPAALARQQRDLLVPAAEKLRRLKRLFAWLGDDRDRVTLEDAARRLAGVV